ncbi:hypothetical protein PCG10_006992 [Penicillium crustosum]|uniref:Uncharacterized protein n=1 Tax=Penicillium crustosum TaxID=36656 RepID=A0A9P5L2G6_PENCR|nr:hypothetical protein PCG10_006992 [Penicillium crustosum]
MAKNVAAEDIPEYLERTVDLDKQLVKQTKSEVYVDPGQEALYQFVDIYFLGYDWVLQWSETNGKDSPVEIELEREIVFRNKTGSEFNITFSVAAEFKGLGMKLETGYKSFSESELSDGRKRREKFIVEPHTSTYYYQKRYNFRTEVWFKADMRGQLYTVGQWKRDGIAMGVSSFCVESEERVGAPKAITGEHSLDVKPIESEKRDNVIRFEHLTARAQTWLHAHKI